MKLMKKKLHIVKIGGNVINSSGQLDLFLYDFAKLDGLKILVHGGGRKATEMADSLGLQPQMIGGRRVTDKANLEIVTMVYAGLLNKNIVAQLQKSGCNALGLSGADANLIRAHKRIVKDIDYGFAGDIDEVDDFKSLGSWMASTEKDIKTRKAAARRACNNLNKIWNSKSLQGIQTKSIYCYNRNGTNLWL